MRKVNKGKFSTWGVAKKNGKKLKLQSTPGQWTQWDHEHWEKGIPLVETEASKQGKFYRAANDTKIAIHGKKNICGYTTEGTKIGIDVQIADVKGTLGSVRRICEAGNRVVFDEDGSYVENKSTGERTALIKDKGSYVLTLWVPRESSPRQKWPFQRQGR